MKIFNLFILVIATIPLLLSCKSKLSKNIQAQNLVATSFFSDTSFEQFKILNNIDNSIISRQGIIINIKASSFNSNEKEINLNFKSVTSLVDIIKNLLSTKTENGLLQTNGMFYLNSADSIEIIKPITIKIPTKEIDTSMKLFLGKNDKNNEIIWEKPKDIIDTSKGLNTNQRIGKNLFIQSCSQCHHTSEKRVAPSMGTISQTRGFEYIYKFTQNPALLIANNCKAQEVAKKYAPAVMTSFPSLNRNDVKNIIEYLDFEAKKNNLKPNDKILTEAEKLNSDSCITYDLNYRTNENNLGNEINKINNELLILNKPINTNTKIDNNVNSSNNISPYQPLYYEIEIEDFGWYNIDKYMIDSSAIQVQENINIIGEYKEKIALYLIMPEEKIYLQGYYLQNENYSFKYNSDDKLILPKNKNAFVFALAEKGDEFFYEIVHLKISEKIDVKTKLKKATLLQIEKELQNLDFDFIKLKETKLQKSNNLLKQIDTLQQQINNMNKLKPNKCDCIPSLDSNSITWGK